MQAFRKVDSITLNHSLHASEPCVFITRSKGEIPAVTGAALRFFEDAGNARVFALQNSWEARFNEAKILPACSFRHGQ